MNKQVRNLYVLIRENRVIHASTSLRDFISSIGNLVTEVKSLAYYYKKFKNQDRIRHVDSLDKVYYMQKVK
jgi:hypothetical protein